MDIPLRGKYGEGKVALADDDTYSVLLNRKWFVTAAGYVTVPNGQKRNLSGSRTLHMHHAITGYTKWHREQGLCVDHINGNPLDNRRGNLRIVSLSVNAMNLKDGRKNNTSGYRGVSYHKTNGKFGANITIGGKPTYIGSYPTAKEASEAYEEVRANRMNILLAELRKEYL